MKLRFYEAQRCKLCGVLGGNINAKMEDVIKFG